MDNEIENLVKLLLKVVCRLEDYMENGVPVPQPSMVVDDYRVTSAEQRIDNRKIQIEKDKKLIKQIKNFEKRRRELKSKSN
jgi:tryptophan synthase alpha subunit